MWPATRAGRRRLLAAAGAVAGYAALTGIARRQRSPRLYRIGLAAPFEGFFRNDGYDALAACRAVVAQWDAEFSALNVRLQVWAVDDGNDPDVAVRRAMELAGDPLVVAVIGHLTPETSAAAAPTYHDAGLLQVSPPPLPPISPPSSAPLPMSLGVPSSAPSAGSGHLTSESRTDLLHLALSLGSTEGPASVMLTAGYCSIPLVRTFPNVAFSAIVPEDTPSLELLVAAAMRCVLDAITAAVREGALSREVVLRAAQASAGDEGWVQKGSALYRPHVIPRLQSCTATSRP